MASTAKEKLDKLMQQYEQEEKSNVVDSKPALADLKGQSRKKKNDNVTATAVQLTDDTPMAASTKKKAYYSRPELGAESESLYSEVQERENDMLVKSWALRRAQRGLEKTRGELISYGGQLDALEASYKADPSQHNAELYNAARNTYNQMQKAYSDAEAAYNAAYDAYMPTENAYKRAVGTYQRYTTAQQRKYEDWRGTIRDSAVVKQELDAVEKQLAELRTQQNVSGFGAWLSNTTRGMIAAGGGLAVPQEQGLDNSAQIAQLEQVRALLQEEYDWGQYLRYADLMGAEDFTVNSKYVPQKRKDQTFSSLLMDNYSSGASGWEDPLYEYVNGNKEAGAYISNMAANAYGPDGGIGAAFGRMTGSKTESQQMTDDEVRIFNYLYATKGKEAAHSYYYDYLQTDLNRRQRMADEQYWRTFAKEHPVASSVFSVAMAPTKGLSYLGQATDFVTDGKIDQNAAYNQYSYANSAIRGQVAEQIEESGNWGPVGSFAYQTGMSMADFLFTTAITGGNQTLSLAVMGSGAAADTTIAAKDRGLEDWQAFTLGTVAGLAEAAMEKVSLDALLDPNLLRNGSLQYIIKNMVAEGSEEVGTDVINLFADILISQDKSEWQKSIDAYVADGKTIEEALGLAMLDQAVTMGLDFLGGAISGGIMSGGSSIAFNHNTSNIGKELGKQNLSPEDVQAFIETGLESDPDTDAYKIAKELQAKAKAGQTISDFDLSRQYQANVQAVAQEQQAEEGTETPDGDEVTGLQLPGLEDDSQGDTADPLNTEDGVRGEVNGSVQPDSSPVSLAEQIRREQKLNGGIENVNTDERSAGPAAAQPESGAAGASVSDGGQGRYAGQSAGKQTGFVAGGTGRSWAQTPGGAKTLIQRQNAAGNLRRQGLIQEKSSSELGVSSGTETKNVLVYPTEAWDQELYDIKTRVHEKTGCQVSFVMGKMEVNNGAGKVVGVRGVYNGNDIIVQIDNAAASATQIADHEIFHAIVDKESRGLVQRIKETIIERFTEEEFAKVYDQYFDKLWCVYGVSENASWDEIEAVYAAIAEELFADAYAGINAFGAGADQFAEIVKEEVDQLYVGKLSNQENGTEKPTGPPLDTYSYDEGGYEGRSLTDDPQIYTYDFLSNQPDMDPVYLPDVSLVRDDDGKIDHAKVVSEGMKNALSVGTERAGKIYVKNRYTGRELWVTASSVRHGLNGGINRLLTNARLGSVVGDVVKNAIPINALHNTASDVEGTYVMAGFAMDDRGREFVAIITVEQRTNSVAGIDVYDMTHAVSGRQKRSKQVDTKSQGVNPSMLASKISIADLLEAVKNTYRSILSEDVLRHMGETKSADGYYSGRVRYSYAGENANNANLDALSRAKEMQAAGVADETIRQETGWFVGMDGKWRWEIDDSGMKYTQRGDLGFRERNPGYARYRELLDKSNRYALELSDEAPTEAERSELNRLGEIWRGTFQKPGRITEDALPQDRLADYLQHDELFEAYPQLRKTTLRFADLPDGIRGQYDPSQNSITLDESLRRAPEDTLVHEIQHAIQNAEGFTPGASVEYWKEHRREITETIAAARQNLNLWLNDIGYPEKNRESILEVARKEKTMEQHWKDMSEFKANSRFARQIAACEAEIAEYQRQYDEITGGMLPSEQYYNTAGEIEARDVTARRSLTPDQRRGQTPARGDENTVFAENGDDLSFAEMDAEYGPQLQSFFDPDISAEEIDGNIHQVAAMAPVTQITGEEFAKGEKDLITQVEEFFAQLGNSVYNEQLGDVIMDRRGIKSDIAHGIGRKKAAAFAAVPDVISRGLIVDYQQNWKGRGYDTAVVAAPITIGTEDHIAAVVLTRSNQTNRFYVHEVLTTKNGAMPFKTGTQKMGASGGDAPSVISILHKILSVKNQNGTLEKYSMDSLGGELTPEQQKYFAQSQARDDSGRLLVLYHQTDGEFTIFDTRHAGAGSKDSDTPFGIFLKRSAGDIGLAGKKQMALYANITNPLRAANREDLARQLREISGSYATISDKHKQLDAQYHEKFEQAKKAWRDYIIEWRAANPGANRSALNDDPKFNELFDAEDAVVDEWTAAADLLSTQAKEAITEDLRKAGYDGVFLENDVGSWGRRTDAIIALDPQQVKNISNKMPTSNPDIRYSVDDTDSQGNTLSAAQKEYFKGSKVRDEQGRLLVMHHGTKSEDFTVFDRNRAKRTGFANFGRGNYFTVFEDGAKHYGNRTITAYLKIENPLITSVHRGAFEADASRALGITADKVSRQTVSGLLKEKGYDGAIMYGMGEDEGKIVMCVAYDSNQIKDISNVTPTSDPDIRYSVDDEGSQQAQEQKPTAPKKKIRPVAESKPLRSKRELRNTVLSMFSIPSEKRAELGAMIDSYADRLLKNGNLTEQDRKYFFDRMYDSGVMTVPADDFHAEARNYVKKGKIYVSESVRAEFGDDWNNFRKQAFGAGVYLTSNRADAGIDQWNAELAETLPGFFDSEDTDLRSILERIIQVAEEGKDEKVSLQEYTARLAGEGYVSEDEFLDNMERQLDWALRTFAEKASLEIDLRDRTGKKIAQEREGFAEKTAERSARQKAREAQRRADEREARKESARRARERKELRELQQKTLKQLQWLNRNRNRAPEELKAAWDEVLGDIDLYAVGAANEMRWSEKHNATWKDLAQMYKDAMKNDPNFLPSKELERIVARLDGTKIAEMDLGALQDLYKAAIGLRTEFYNRNNVINDEMNRLFGEVYADAKREIETAPGGFTGKVLDKFLNLDQLTPMNVLQRMAGWDPNGAFYSMAKQLERGERDMRAYSVKAQKMLQDFLTEHEDWVKIADGQGKDAIWYEVEVPQLLELGMGDKPIFGPTVKVYMTPAQKVHMYLESKNLDNLRHMTGGRTFVDKELYSQGKRQEALSQGRTIKLAPETVRKLVSDLTAEEMELAKILDQYYNTFATQEINKVSNILYGYDKAMGKNYAPIYTNRNYTKTEFGVFDTTAEGVGNLKGRQYAVNPSYNISAFDAFERHVDQTARFCGMAIPARNWTTLMNWREKNNSTGDVITHKWGEESKRYISDLITTLQGGDDAKSDTISSGLSKLQSNYITAIFGANPSIVMKQLGSIPLAGAYLDARNVPTPAQIASIDRNLISKYTQELEWRTMGYTTPETKQLKDNPNWTQTNKVFKFVFGGGAITAMDGWAASTLWPWAENKVRREHPEQEVGTQDQVDAGESAFYKKVAEEFENAISRSQSVSDEIHQSTLRKSKNPITKAFTMFRSDSAQTYNALRQKIGEARYYMRTGAKDKVIQTAKKAAGTAFVAMLLNAAWSEAVSFLMAMWKNKGKYYRDDEDELTFQSVAGEMVSNMFGSFAGVVTGGEELFELIGNIVTGDTWYGIETPGMEQLNDLVDVLAESGSGMRDVVAGGWDVLKNGGNLGDYFSKHSGQILGGIKDLAEATAMYLPGLPASNLEAYLVGAMKWISPELGAAYDDLFSDTGKSDLAGMEGNALEGRISRILSDRKVSESDSTAATLAALYEAGYKTAIPGDTPASVSINGEKKSLGAYKQQAYDTIWGGVVAIALDDMVASDSFAEADPKTQAKMLSNLYAYAAERAKDELFDEYEIAPSATAIDTLQSAGMDLAECVAWTTVASGMKQVEKFAALRDWDMTDKAKQTVIGEMIGTELQTATGKPTQYAMMQDALKQGLSVDEYLDMRIKGTDVKDYLDLVSDGMEEDLAHEFANYMEDLETTEGDGLGDLIRWRACIDFSADPEDQMAALSMVMSDAQMVKVEIAQSFGVDPDAYVKFYEVRGRYDADGNGSYKQTEVKAAIDAEFGNLSLERKAALWQIATGSSSAKNNPYSCQVGQEVLDAKTAAKEKQESESELEGLSLGNW